MPIVKIEDAVTRSPAVRRAIVACIFDGLKAVFGVSDEELQARYSSFCPEDFFPPAGDADYLHVEIIVFAGRTLATKKKLYARLAADLSALLNIAPHSVLVLLREQPGENWGMRGGLAACDIDFGYDIAV